MICTTFRSDFHVSWKNQNRKSTLNLSFDTLFKWHEPDIIDKTRIVFYRLIIFKKFLLFTCNIFMVTNWTSCFTRSKYGWYGYKRLTFWHFNWHSGVSICQIYHWTCKLVQHCCKNVEFSRWWKVFGPEIHDDLFKKQECVQLETWLIR